MEEKKAAFDIQVLVANLKGAGLPIAEEAGHAVVKVVFDWLEQSVKDSDSKVDDFALAVISPLRAFIDGKVGGISK